MVSSSNLLPPDAGWVLDFRLTGAWEKVWGFMLTSALDLEVFDALIAVRLLQCNILCK